MPLADPSTDIDLMRRMRSGDAAAMAMLYERHQAALYRFALLRCGAESVAADVVQDVFMALIENKLAFDPTRGTLGAFLMGVARNFLLKRDEAAGRFLPLATDEDGETLDIEGSAPSPLEQLLGNDRAERVRKALMTLAPHYRDVLVLYELQDMSYIEIAEICRIDLGTVRSRLSRARDKLAALLALDAPAKAAADSAA